MKRTPVEILIVLLFGASLLLIMKNLGWSVDDIETAIGIFSTSGAHPIERFLLKNPSPAHTIVAVVIVGLLFVSRRALGTGMVASLASLLVVCNFAFRATVLEILHFHGALGLISLFLALIFHREKRYWALLGSVAFATVWILAPRYGSPWHEVGALLAGIVISTVALIAKRFPRSHRTVVTLFALLTLIEGARFYLVLGSESRSARQLRSFLRVAERTVLASDFMGSSLFLGYRAEAAGNEDTEQMVHQLLSQNVLRKHLLEWEPLGSVPVVEVKLGERDSFCQKLDRPSTVAIFRRADQPLPQKISLCQPDCSNCRDLAPGLILTAETFESGRAF